MGDNIGLIPVDGARVLTQLLEFADCSEVIGPQGEAVSTVLIDLSR